MTTCHACQRPLDKTAEGYVYCGERVYHMGCEPSSFPRLGDREVSEKNPKYPIGSLVAHRASMERALVVRVDTYSDESKYWTYYLEFGIDKCASYSEELMDERFLPVIQRGGAFVTSSSVPE